MLSAFLWGLLAASSLILGGLVGSWLTPGKRLLGIIMAFGAGVLFSAAFCDLRVGDPVGARGQRVSGAPPGDSVLVFYVAPDFAPPSGG